MIRVVLFDIDGTLLDSNDAHAQAWLEALREQGKNVSAELVRTKLGAERHQFLRDLGIDPESPEGRRLGARHLSVFRTHYLLGVGPLPGARGLVDRLESRGLTCAVVTLASEPEAADLLRAAGVIDLFEHVVCASDALSTSHGLVERALQRTGANPCEAVLVADTPYDVQAARQAGVGTIALRTGGWHDAALEGAIAIFDSPADLASRIEDSPLALEANNTDLRSSTRGRRAPAMRWV